MEKLESQSSLLDHPSFTRKQDMQNQHYSRSLTSILLSVGSFIGLACVSDHETTDMKEVVTESASVPTRSPAPQDRNAAERVGESVSPDVIRRTTPSPIGVERKGTLKSTESRQELTDEKTIESASSVIEVEATETADEAAESDVDPSKLKSTEAWTAMDQGNSRRDMEITRSIRRKVSGDNNLSIYARNIVVITKGGIVALKGTVRSDEEKMQAERIARDVEGVADVSNHLNIRPR